MLTSETNFWRIREAVLKNTCRPLPEESPAHDPKSLRVSILREGDSQVGIILLIGVALELGFNHDQITTYEGVEKKEIMNKLELYNHKVETNERFRVKRKLILNYLRYV